MTHVERLQERYEAAVNALEAQCEHGRLSRRGFDTAVREMERWFVEELRTAVDLDAQEGDVCEDETRADRAPEQNGPLSSV